MSEISINIGKLKLKNPVMVASGTFGYAEEFTGFIDLRKLGAIVTKTITLKPRNGNPPPRTAETPAGLLNSIGLENPGMDRFIEEKLPCLINIGVPIIVSVSSEKNPDEFAALCQRLDKMKEISAIELNISCPNIKSAKLISQDPRSTYAVVKMARGVTGKVLITKLSPNVTSIEEIALAAEDAGTDALSLINTLSGMSIDVKTRRPKIASGFAGLSGPAIRPIAVRMVWEVYQKVKVPIIGMGGIMDTQSALEFIICGASAISTGTANFVNPAVSIEIIDGIKRYLKENHISDIKNLIGSLKI